MTQAFAVSILALTISVAIGRPFLGPWRLGHVEAALGGAVLTLLLGVVTPSQAANALSLLAMPIITVASLMAITVIAEQSGVLGLLAYRIACASNGDARRLFSHLFVLGTLTGTLFTNDAAILILTPMVSSLMQSVQLQSWTGKNRAPFYFAILYVGNLVGALVTSNPINLVVTSIFDIPFATYAAWMIVPALASMAVSFAGLRYFFRDVLPRECLVPERKASDIADHKMVAPCILVLVLVLAGFFSESLTGIPVWLVALSGALVLTAIHRMHGASIGEVVRGIGWDVILFVIGIFIVVIGLRNNGFAHMLGDLIETLGGTGMTGLSVATSFVAAVCSALVNNHPTAGLMIWVIEDFGRPLVETQMLVFSALIGGDLGPKMLPIGSLAALMWFRILRQRGEHIPYSLYIRVGIPVTLLAVLVSVLTLNLEYLLYAELIGVE